MNSPIGIFDSGYGGLTVLKSIKKLLPPYDYLYLGDNARAPYGSRSFDVVYQYTREAIEYLFKQNCPLIILACNTASAKALRPNPVIIKHATTTYLIVFFIIYFFSFLIISSLLSYLGSANKMLECLLLSSTKL